MALLQVNQQIRDEVIDIMPRKLGQRIDDAKLDVLFVGDINRQLWGTWLSAPFSTSNLNTLHAEIRVFQITRCSFENRLKHPPASTGQDCRYWVYSRCAEMLLKFLTDFLQSREGKTSVHKAQGIGFAAENQGANRAIQNVAINIPFELDQQDSLETRVQCFWCTNANDDAFNNDSHRMIPSGKRAALIFAQSLHNQLLRIFETPPRDWHVTNYHRTLFEAVGTIHLKVAGRPFASMDLSKILAKIPCDEGWHRHGVTRSEFFEWKRLAEERRKTAGFTLVDTLVQEHELVGSAGIIAGMLSSRSQNLVRKVTMFPKKVAPFTRVPAVNERVAFKGKAVFVQEDGHSLPGNAMFYQPAHLPWSLGVTGSSAHWMYRYYLPKRIEEQLEDGEIVLFKSEAILFQADWTETTITSGEATFYGPAEDRRTKQPEAIQVDSPQAGDHRGCFVT